jgi:glycogen(starch) synthase
MNSSGIPRRVLMTADTVGGVWTYALDLTRALGEAGIEVLLAGMGGFADREQRNEARALPNLELVESEYRLPWMDDPWEDVRAAGDWLLDLMARFAPDLVHLNEPVHGSLPWATPTVAVAHSCVVSWWQSVWKTAPPTDWDRYREEMSLGLQHADEVVAPSRWLLDTLRRNYCITGGRVIANGRDSQGLYPEPKESLIFAAGRLWDPAKNFSLIQDAGLRQALAMRARRRALTLTPRRMARAYVELYAELLEARVQAEDHACAS